MPQLLGPDGKPISSRQFENKKSPPPKLGDAFGAWAGRDLEFMTLPGGGVIQFDLSKLTLEDYRNMRDHYQVNASLSVLTFMQHQSDFHIECEDARIANFCEEQIRDNWTMLNRGMAQANWAGFSPNVLQWENEGRNIVLDKVKDLVPEECTVKWDEVKGWAPPGRVAPKYKVYGGIKQFGTPWPIPVENTLWYPLLMENGNYSGRKLLRPAFTPYFFSILVHLFSNRYYERFGEPTPVGRAPFDDDITVNKERIPSNQFMLNILRDLRNRSVVVLPNDKTQYGSENNPSFDYDLEYLESQMRGADFERYLTRLDEEISIGLFTPILLMRTADVGSYNLGQGHMQMYLWMLNAMNDDRKVYIDKYILNKMANYNFGPNSARPKIVFRKLGNSNAEMIKELLTALTQQGKIKFDTNELGQIAGLTVEEIAETVNRPAPAAAPDTEEAEPPDSGQDSARPATITARSGDVRATAKAIVRRVSQQVNSAFENGTFGPDLRINMGFKRRMEASFKSAGHKDPKTATDSLYASMDYWLKVATSFPGDFDSPTAVIDMFSDQIQQKVDYALQV